MLFLAVFCSHLARKMESQSCFVEFYARLSAFNDGIFRKWSRLGEPEDKKKKSSSTPFGLESVIFVWVFHNGEKKKIGNVFMCMRMKQIMDKQMLIHASSCAFEPYVILQTNVVGTDKIYYSLPGLESQINLHVLTHFPSLFLYSFALTVI